MPNGRVVAVPYGTLPYLGPSLTKFHCLIVVTTPEKLAMDSPMVIQGSYQSLSRIWSFKLNQSTDTMQVPKSRSLLVKVPNMQLF